jgi:hypothetical protein
MRVRSVSAPWVITVKNWIEEEISAGGMGHMPQRAQILVIEMLSGATGCLQSVAIRATM